MNDRTGVTGYEEERLLFKRYLSDEIAPMIFANSAAELFEVPSQIVIHAIQSWIGDQFRGASNMTAGDLIYHAATKIHQLGILELMPQEDVSSFLDQLKPALLQLCPAEQRPGLEVNFGHLEKSTSIGSSKTDVLHKPAQAGGGGGYAVGGGGYPAGAPQAGGAVPVPAGSAPAGAVATVPAAAADPGALYRLNLLLDRLQQMAAQPVPAAASVAGQNAVLAHVVEEVASQAGTSRELETQLDFLKEMGVSGVDAGLIQQLSQSLPDWAPPPPEAVSGAEPPAGAARAMRKVVKLSKDREELTGRFKELVNVAVEEFNGGSLGRAVTMLDLAGRMIDQGEIAEPIAETVFEEGYSGLDIAHLEALADDPDKRLLLRRVLQFFPTLRVDNLMTQLIEEGDREARLRVLKLLRAHGGAARSAAVGALDDSLSGTARHPADVERNLLYLMRAIPSADDDTLDHEIDLLVRTSDLREALPVVRESFSVLSQLKHPRAYGVLAARISELEDGLTATTSIPLDAKETRLLLGNTIKRLCSEPDNDSLEIVITHGLKGTPQLGDTYARLVQLASHDLARFPAQVVRITDAISEELPRKILGMSMGNQRRALILEPLITAISGTRSPEVLKLLGEIAKKYGDQPYGQKAAEALKKSGRQVPAPAAAAEDSITLSGDLGLFGLPNLLQNLADNRLSGALKVVDANGSQIADFEFSAGELVSAHYGKLSHDTAVYQMIEQPVEGRFQFINDPSFAEDHPNAANALNVMGLMMEGMRRFDEFTRASALIPDDAVFKPTSTKASDVQEDGDPRLAKAVWERASKGAPAALVESELEFDAFRVRRLYEHWVTEGSLARVESGSPDQASPAQEDPPQ